MNNYVIGIDEAGRGALAGPVVAAAVIFSKEQDISTFKDSKKLTHTQRENIYEHIISESLAIGIGVVHHDVIDRINILQATFVAMKKAVLGTGLSSRIILIDGNKIIPGFDNKQKSIIKGDDKVPLISAASIVAKVIRDRIMCGYGKVYCEYGFAQHKGYGTKLHYSNISRVGLSKIHRRSFNTSEQLSLF
ncbi:MAG: ribonuclease HII [Candidatus Margulisbacteria bacterium]|nr:ribonuclease HII [Candidatus Margulisiibacteriota bacterium]